MPHSRFGNDDGLQIQKAIQSLRLETQEALAEYREEIARLEEENEIKQMRIEEIDAELDELRTEEEFGRTSSIRKIQTSGRRGRAQRRWSLAVLGGSFLTDGNEEMDAQQLPKRRSKSVDKDNGESYDAEDPTRPNRFNLAAVRRPSLLHTKPKADTDSQIETEAILLQRLHEVQEENKRLIHQQETNLKFKEEQVIALRLAYEEQEKIIDNLEDEIDRARDEGENKTRERSRKHDTKELEDEKLDDEDSLQDDAEELQERLTELNHKENEISSQIRLLKRVKNMDSKERKTITSSVKKDIVESAVRLKAIKHEFDEQYEALRQHLSKAESEWALLKVELSLAETVSQKQVGRLQKKAARGESTELTQLIELAIQALQEELAMRESSGEITRKVLHLETLNLEKLIAAMLDCCDTFVECVLQLKSKRISGPIGACISDIIRQVEKGISIADNTVSLALVVLEETKDAYQHDNSLLPDAVLAAYFSSNHGLDSVCGEDEEQSSTTSSLLSVEDVDLSFHEDNTDDIDEQPGESRQRLHDKHNMDKSTQSSTTSTLEELVSKYKHGCAQWDLKDAEFARAMRDADDAKVAEDRLREFLERTVRARVASDD